MQPCNELTGRALGSVLWMHHEQHVWEAGAEVGTIGVMMTRRLGNVDVLTPRTVELHHCFPRHVGQPYMTQNIVNYSDLKTKL